MKKVDITNEVPELIGLIEINGRIEQMEALLYTAKEAQNNIASSVIQKLNTYEQDNKVWLGEDITVEYNNQNYLIKGLNDNHNEPLKVMLLEHLLVFKDKQTKGTEREKEKS